MDVLDFIESFRFLSSSLDSSVKLLADNNHESLKNLKKEIVSEDNILNFGNEIETLVSEDRIFEDIKNDFPDAIEKLEQALDNYISEYLKLVFMYLQELS